MIDIDYMLEQENVFNKWKKGTEKMKSRKVEKTGQYLGNTHYQEQKYNQKQCFASSSLAPYLTLQINVLFLL